MASASTVKASKQKMAYINQFNRQKYDRLNLVIPKGQKEVLQGIAKEHGMSLNEMYMTAITEWLSNKGINLSDLLDEQES